MSRFVFLIIFLVVGGLFWVIKTVAEFKARQSALEQYGQDSDEEYDENVDEDVAAFESDTLQEFARQEYTQNPEKASAPSRPEPPRSRPAPSPVIPPQSDRTRRRKSSYANWISHHAKNAIIAQEILGPPKGTNGNRNW